MLILLEDDGGGVVNNKVLLEEIQVYIIVLSQNPLLNLFWLDGRGHHGKELYLKLLQVWAQ